MVNEQLPASEQVCTTGSSHGHIQNENVMRYGELQHFIPSFFFFFLARLHSALLCLAGKEKESEPSREASHPKAAYYSFLSGCPGSV